MWVVIEDSHRLNGSKICGYEPWKAKTLDCDVRYLKSNGRNGTSHLREGLEDKWTE